MYHCILSETFKLTSWGNQPHDNGVSSNHFIDCPCSIVKCVSASLFILTRDGGDKYSWKCQILAPFSHG